MTVRKITRLHATRALLTIFLLRPLSPLAEPVLVLRRAQLRRSATACGYTLQPSRRGGITLPKHDGLIFMLNGDATRYGYMGQHGLPEDLNLAPNQYAMSIGQTIRFFERMLRITQRHDIDTAYIPLAFELACTLRARAETHYDIAQPRILNFETCLLLTARFGQQLTNTDLVNIARRSSNLEDALAIVRLRGDVPDNLLYDMFPVVEPVESYR